MYPSNLYFLELVLEEDVQQMTRKLIYRHIRDNNSAFCFRPSEENLVGGHLESFCNLIHWNVHRTTG